MLRQPLTKQQVMDCIERRQGGCVPLVFHKWWGEGLEEKYGHQALQEAAAEIPDDIVVVSHTAPGLWTSPTADPQYCWSYSKSPQPTSEAKDAAVLLPTWDELPAYVNELPNPDNQAGIFEQAAQTALAHPDRYILGHWWFCFYERLWSIRGMENVLMDFLLHPDELQVLSKAILEHHRKVIRGFAAAGVDGIFVSDDLGAQTSLMMSPTVFRAFLKPLYRELIAEAHRHGLHFWLHSCGNISSVLEDFVEIGLDVIHPIQIGTMDLHATAAQFGGRISFLVGFDVQHLLPEGSPEEVRDGVRELWSIFARPEGGLLMAAGNGILPGTPLANIRAFLETSTSLTPSTSDPS